MMPDSEFVKGIYKENQRMIVLLEKAEKKILEMYNAISNGHGEAFASQDDLVKEIREFLKYAI